MPSIYDIHIGDRFSFEVYPSSVFGNNFKNVRLEGIISAQSAASFGVDVASIHANVYPTLPPGTVPDNPFGYGYIRFQHPSGEYGHIGIPWIRPESIQLSASTRYTLVFNDRTQPDLDRIITALSANGQRPDEILSDS